MVAACGSDDQVVAVIREIHCNRRYDRRRGVFEINSHNAAVCTGNLIHQSAGFAEVDVLRLLAHDCKLRSGESVVIV